MKLRKQPRDKLPMKGPVGHAKDFTESYSQQETLGFLAGECCDDICAFRRLLCNHGVNVTGKGNERGWGNIWAAIVLIQDRDEGFSNLQFMASIDTWQMIVND